MPDRHPRSRPVARVRQPDDLLQPDDAASTRSRSGRPTPTTSPIPTPARYTWTVGQPANCDQANITLIGRGRRLGRSGQPRRELPPVHRPRGAFRAPSAMPAAGEPVIGQNARALVRFHVAERTPPVDCPLESATLRLYDESADRGPHAHGHADHRASWSESTLTWSNQPGIAGSHRRRPRPGPATGAGMSRPTCWPCSQAGSNHGWSIRDAVERIPTAATRPSPAARRRRTRRRSDPAGTGAAVHRRRSHARSATADRRPRRPDGRRAAR